MKRGPNGEYLPESDAEKAQLEAMFGPGAGGGQPPSAPPVSAGPAVAPPAAKPAEVPPVVVPTPSPEMREGAAVREARRAAEEKAKREAAEKALAEEKARAATQESSVQAQLAAMQAQLTAESNARYVAQLSHYREQVVASYQGRLVESMVPAAAVNVTPEMIVAAAANAAAEYKRIADANRAEFLAEQARMVPTHPVVPGAPPAPVAVAVPNVAHGMPTVPNPQPPAASNPAGGLPDLGQYTTEDAVRNGTYAKNRAAIQQGLRTGHIIPQANPGPPAAIGAAPPPPPVYTQGPGGVQVPHGFPSGPVMPKGLQHTGIAQPAAPPVFQGGQPQAGGDPSLAAAQAAVQRTHAGQNPVAGANRGGAAAQAETAAFAQGTGQNPSAAFAARFSQ